MLALTTQHYCRVTEFMQLARQCPPIVGTAVMPNEATRLLRARLIYEEAMETVHALGCSVNSQGEVVGGSEPDLVEIIDGCADVSVVTIGTLIACGVPDESLLKLVDENNLAKFGPGCSFREDGKVVKPPGHTPPDIGGFLIDCGWNRDAI